MGNSSTKTRGSGADDKSAQPVRSDLFQQPNGKDMANESTEGQYRMYNYDNTWLQPQGPGDTEETTKKDEKQSRIMKFVDDYAGSTSFHGIVWTRGAESTFGRFIWLLIVLGAASFLTFQIQDRIRHYLGYPVTVDIQIIIAEELTFPAVTICNTNAFKISKAAETGTYLDLTNFYIDGNGDKLKNKSLRFYDVVQALSHKKEDFIRSCEWLNNPCSDSDFREELTDFGVCYTFNGYNGSTNFKTIGRTGAQYGLQLILNTESYEAMAGPHTYGGVKVEVHHPLADPQVQDLGLSVPPTMSAFIGLTMEESNFLEPPHGKCAKEPPIIGGSLAVPDGRGYSKSKCETECYAVEVNKTCGCVASYMPMLIGSQYCTLIKEVTCVLPEIDKAKQDGTCSGPYRCPYNCVENFYQRYVTYSALSESELIRLAHNYSYDRTLSEKYRNATILRHQLVDELYQKEKHLVVDAVHSLEQFIELVSSPTGLNAFLKNWSSVIQNDIGVSLKTLQDLSVATTVVRRSFDDMFGLSSLLTFMMEYSVNIKFGTEFLAKKTDYHLQKSNLNTQFDYYKSVCAYWELNLEDDYLMLAHLLPLTSKKITEAWSAKKKAPKNAAAIVWLSHAENNAQSIINYFTNLVDNMNTFADYMKQVFCVRARSTDPNPTFNEQEKDEATAIALEYLLHVDKTINGSTQSLRNTDEKTNRQAGEIYDVAAALRQRINMLTIRLAKAQKAGDEITTLLNIVYDIFKRFKVDFETGNPPSKIGMLNTLDAVMKGDKQSFLIYFDSLMREVVADLEQFLQTMRDTDDIVTSAMITMNNAVELDNIDDVINVTRPMQSRLQDMVSNFSRIAADFTNYATTLDSRLRVQFNETISEIDLTFVRDNFIQMNFYFQSLTYTTVIRQPGYTWFSLLCDCGGTAGLYLGASFLSIIELLYFVAKFFIEAYLEMND